MSTRTCRPVPNAVFHVVSEQPRRLRLRGPVIAHPCLDLAYLQALLAARTGVAAVRVNPRARLGGDSARDQIAALGIRPGSVLTLENVGPDLAVDNEDGRDCIVVTSADGLRLYLKPDQAASIIVDVEGTAT